MALRYWLILSILLVFAGIVIMIAKYQIAANELFEKGQNFERQGLIQNSVLAYDAVIKKYPFTYANLKVGKKLGYRNIIKFLSDTKHYIDTGNFRGKTSLYVASKNGNLVLAKFLLNNGSDVNATVSRKGDTPIIFAIKNKNKRMIEILIDAGAKINTEHILKTTITDGNLDILKFLELKGGDFIDKKFLEFALRKNKFLIVKYILESGVDVEQYHILPAVISGNTKAVELILAEKGVSPNYKNNQGEPIIYIAALKGFKGIVELLIANNANLDYRNNAGLTALHVACRENNEAIAIKLIKAGSLINPLDKNGRTPFDYARTHPRSSISSNLYKLGLKNRLYDNKRKGYNVINGKWNGALFGGTEVTNWKYGDENNRFGD